MGWFWSGWQQQPSETGNRTHTTPSPGDGGSHPQLNTVAWCLVTAVVVTGGPLIYKRHLRRVRNVDYLTPRQFRTKTLFGHVTRVGDGDNFRFYHTPGGRLAGWGWLRSIPTKAGDLKDETLHVRIAGIDAPELPHFGRPGQPHGQDAIEWLNNQLLDRRVRIRPLSKDQYGRVVGTVRMPYRLWNRDPGMQMIKAGWATVYDAKSGAEYGGQEQEYRDAEARAKKRRVGMWGGQNMIGKLLGKKQEPLESPREFKARTKKEEIAPK